MTLTDVLAAAQPATRDWMFLGMPAAVVASLVVGTASIVVALVTTTWQSHNAAKARTDDAQARAEARQEDRAREDRQARVVVHSAITNRALELSASYGDYLREIHEWSGDPQQEPMAPSNAPLNTALTGLLTSLGEEAIYRASVEYFGRMIMHLQPKDFLAALSSMQQTLDDWFIDKTTAEQAAGVLLRLAGELQAAGKGQTA